MIIRHDTDNSAYQELARGFPAVCCLNAPQEAKGVGTLVGPKHVLTAAHSVKKLSLYHPILVAGKPYQISEIIIHPSWYTRPTRPNKDEMKNVADLAVLRLAEPVVDIVPLGLCDSGDEVGRVATFVGRGCFGNGESGPQDMDYRWRAATNRVEEVCDQWLGVQSQGVVARV